jgi:NitT/TauT family transport system ATP-binding protein
MQAEPHITATPPAGAAASPDGAAPTFPSYKDPPQPVRERFQRIYQRPVVMEVRGLGKKFENRGEEIEVLRGLDFRVHRREFVCIVGQSGCGKSTLIRILAGLETLTDGVVEVGGQPVDGPGPDRGMVFQSYTLFPWLTVKGNVMFGLREKGIPYREAEQEVRKWVEAVDLGPFLNAYPYQLSGGMKQRVAIARALANHPSVLLMDEPFGALDAQTRAQMQQYLQLIWMNIDVTILFITHDLDEAVLLADRVIVLSAGPGRIAEIIEVPLLQPRKPDAIYDPWFIATRVRIEELIHRHEAASQDRMHVRRMTEPGDEIF